MQPANVSLYTVFDAKQWGDRIFQGGPNISRRSEYSEILVPGVQIFQQKLSRGSKYFDIFGPGGTKNGGPVLRDRSLQASGDSLDKDDEAK